MFYKLYIGEQKMEKATITAEGLKLIGSLLGRPENLFTQFFGKKASAWDMARISGTELETGATPVANDLLRTMLDNSDKLSKDGIGLAFYFISQLTPDNTVKCSLKKLAKELDCSTKEIKQAVSELEEIGICRKIKHATGLYTFVINN